MSSRERVLGRVRRALADVREEHPDTGATGGAAHTDGGPARDGVARDYLRVHGERTAAERVELLATHLADYRARVHRTDPAGLPDTVAALLAARGARRVVVPEGLPADWLSASAATPVPDTPALSARDLDAVDSVVTGCAVAIAETGTLVLDAGPGQGRRQLTLVPDHHVCVVHVPGQVVDSLPQALERLVPHRPLTWISGPSATSDIELSRVEGVHGPRALDVVLVTTDAPSTASSSPR
ncbi:LUD domain-containing protein [Streptomyces sp. 71268]|uniref:LutC/YkgG family protein n=1 Tax=Streptomyces sp. 71268 TaxID=3002640 RepID=UPI0023F83A8F|nr:LUD domain-containing protein [Streptomyces sp. 71268]WEV29079.1 LUD domain-containing protein [Streptomyces sp. 71268]